jgi:hypothetical protein
MHTQGVALGLELSRLKREEKCRIYARSRRYNSVGNFTRTEVGMFTGMGN